MNKLCDYDDVISKAITGKPLLDCISELEKYEQDKATNRHVRTKERLEQSIVLILSMSLVVNEIFSRAKKNLPPTETLPFLVELGKLFNIRPIEDLENLFSYDEEPTSVSYDELIGIDQNSTILAVKIADKASILHTEMAKIITLYAKIAKLAEGSKIVKNTYKRPKMNANHGHQPDDIDVLKERLKYFRKKLPKVTLKEITEAPASQLHDLEMITKIDKTLALHFERSAKHLELVANSMDSDVADKIYKEFVKIRMDSGIPVSEMLQKIITLHGWS